MTNNTDKIIKYFVDNEFMLWNIDINKRPIVGTGQTGWSKITYNDSKKYYNPKNTQIGFRTGLQPNNKFIIGLDFDMWVKSCGKYIACNNTRKLYDEFSKLNTDNYGTFSSSTEMNRGILVDITNSKKLINIISNDGRAKIQKPNYCLEILTNFNMILPPSITKCKKTGLLDRKRSFLSSTYVLEILQDTEIESFIFNYINDCKKDNKPIQKHLKNKKEKIAFLNYENVIDSNEIYCKSIDVLRLFIDKLDLQRVKNYNEWYKIGYAIKNSFGLSGINLFKYFSMRDKDNYDESNCIYYYNKVWVNTTQYEGLSSNYIMNCCMIDNPENFIKLLLLKDCVSNIYNYIDIKIEFEKNVRKILEPDVFIKKNRITKKWEYCSINEILHTYIDVEPFDKDFLDDYFSNNTLNSYKNLSNSILPNKVSIINKLKKDKYDSIDFIPDINFNELNKDNMRIFNMFEGYKIKNHKIKNPNENYIKLFQEHLNVLVNNNKNAYTMLLQWICHLIFNTTKRPGISIILKGDEGSGKTTLYELISSLIGLEYCYQTPRPEKTIFTQFNSVLKNKILININEPDFNSFKGGFEEFKSLITDSKFDIEEKQKPKISLSNNMWFLLTTNNDKLFTLSMTERRFYFIETSSNKIGNRQYFNNIYDMFSNKDAMKCIYDYLKENINMDFNFQYYQKECKTEFHSLLTQSSQNPFYEFLQDLIENEIEDLEKYKQDIIIQPKDFLTKYKRYCNDNSLSCNENAKSILLKFGKMGNSKKKLSNYNKWYYCINPQNTINWLKNQKQYNFN